jgi:hypothetical protein
MQPSISRSMWHRWSLDQCWPDMWKSLDMHMHTNGWTCMESYPEVVSFLINVSMHNQRRSPSMICICVSVSSRIWFRDLHIWRIWEFHIWIFIVHIRGLGYNKFDASLIAKSGGKLCTIIVKLFTWKFLQVPTSSYINLFRWILYFNCSYLRFRV